MTAPALPLGFRETERAIRRLAEALAEPEANRLAVDGTIQRFEFSFELFWKLLSRLLLAQGAEVTLPREALERAYAAGWIDDEGLWLNMLADRNRTSHLYKEELARKVYGRIRTYQPLLKRALSDLARRFALR